MIQTISIPGASKEGLLSSEALAEQASVQTANGFAELYSFPALYVNDVSAAADEESGIGDATVRARPQLQTVIVAGAAALRYLQRVGFLVKRPGNPFPQFVSIGRAANNDIVFGVDSISKFHAYFSSDGGRWAITDYRSTNGTFLNGTRLPPNQPTPVADGNQLRFGEQLSALFLEPTSLYLKLKA